MPFVADEVIMQNVAQGSIYRSMPMPEVDRIVVGERYIDPDLPVVSELRAPETGFYEGIAAMSRRENSILSSFVNSTDALIEGEYDPDFNPFDEIKADGAEHYGDTLGHAFNKQHYDAMKEKLYQQERDIQLVEKSGTFTQLVGGVAAGAIDPLSYLGGGAALKLLKGRSALTQGAGIGFGSTAMPEIYLQATQELRTSEEAYWNVVGGSLLGAALGGGIQAYKATNRSTANKIIKKLRQDITRDTPDTIDVLRRQGMDASKVDTGKGVGADAVGRDINTARVYRQGIEDIMRGMEIKNAAGFQKLWKGMTPLMRSLNSPFVQTRFTMQKLLNTPFKLEKNAGGEATEQSIEKLAELYTDDYINAAVKTKDLYAKYKGSTSNALPRTRESLRNAFKKDSIPTSFHEEIGKAVRRNGKHPNAIIAESAKVWRKFFDDIGAEAVRSGIWKELPDRKVAESYFTRMFDKDAILDDAENYKNIVREYITEQTLKAVDSIEAKYTRMENGLQSQIDKAELNSFRKASQLQERAEIEGGELGLNIDDIKDSLEILAQGKPKKPQTMGYYIAKNGGIRIDERMAGNFNMEDVKSWNKTNRARLFNEANEGGRYLDDIGEELWQEGFFPTYRERPEIDEILEALDDELRDLNPRVRETELDDWNDWNYYKDLESNIGALGIKPKDYKGGRILLPDDKLKQLRDAYIKGSDLKSKKLIKELKAKKAKLKAKKDEELLDIRVMGVDAYADEVTQQHYNQILGLDNINPDFKFNIAERGPLKNLKFLIPDERIEKFLVNDIDVVASRYARTVGADIELMNKFGSVKIDDILEPLNREVAELEGLAKTKEEKKVILKAAKADKKDLEAAVELIRGTYSKGGDPDGRWARLANIALQYNYVRMLGGVALSSIPDIGKLVLYNGFGTFYEGSAAKLSKRVGAMGEDLKAMSKEDAKLAGLILEGEKNSKAMLLGDVSFRYSQRSGFENFMETSSKVFTKATGITWWNNFMQEIGSYMSQNRMLRNLENIMKDGKIDAKEAEYMAVLGFEERTMKQMGAEWSKYGKKDGDFRVANLKEWTDPDMRKMYRAALKKDVESIVLRKDIGDVPLFANTPLGKLMLQFKSFMFATTTKTLIPALQNKDKATIQGMSVMLAMGMLTYIIKGVIGGRDVDLTPEKLLLEGIDRSGILGPIMEVNNIWEKMGGYGLGRMSGAPVASRFASRTAVESIMGASLGTAYNLTEAARAFLTGEVSDNDRKNIRRLIPFHNLWIIEGMMTAAGKESKAVLGY